MAPPGQWLAATGYLGRPAGRTDAPDGGIFRPLRSRVPLRLPIADPLGHGLLHLLRHVGGIVGLCLHHAYPGHVLVDVVINKFSPANRRVVQICIHAVILAFALTITAAGVHSCVRAYQMKELTMSALYIPLYYPMSSIPVGFGLMALEELATLFNLILLKSSDILRKEEALP